MKRVLVISAVYILAGLWPNQAQREVLSQSLPSSDPIITVAHAQEREPAVPVRVSIPSIKLNSPIQQVGLDEFGRMDVPSGLSNKVGWYSKGALPGEKGSAVLDAHVYAAFKNLHKAKAGDEIYITDEADMKRKFIIQEMRYFALDNLSPEELFNRQDARRLTLITCAGNKTGDDRGYDQRLVVSAVLAE